MNNAKYARLNKMTAAYDVELAAAVPVSNEAALAELRSECADWLIEFLEAAPVGAVTKA